MGWNKKYKENQRVSEKQWGVVLEWTEHEKTRQINEL